MILFLEEIIETSSSVAESVADSVASSSEGIAQAVEPVTEWIKTAWEWMNNPLPIVGVSLIAILVFLWRFLSSTSFGKKALKKLSADFEETKKSTSEQLEAYRAENERMKEELSSREEELAMLQATLGVVCSTSRNKQVKEAYQKMKEEESDGEGKESEEAVDGDAKQE